MWNALCSSGLVQWQYFEGLPTKHMFRMKIIITTCYKYYSHILLHFIQLTCVQFQAKMWTLLCFEPQHNNYVAPETNYKFKWNCIILAEKNENPKWKIYTSTLKLWTVVHVLKTILLYNKNAFILAHYQKNLVTL